MAIPSIIVKSAKNSWNWQWRQLMNGLGPTDQEGNYTRPISKYQSSSISLIPDLSSRTQGNLPTLIIGRSCPWAHRTWLTYELRGLSHTINLLIASANHQTGRWILKPPLLKKELLSELYIHCGSGPNLRATVPVLIDPKDPNLKTPRIIGNESTQLIRTLNQWPTNSPAIDLEPKELLTEINDWQNIIQPFINDGVYKCGFARNQNAYEKASENLFGTLKIVDQSLSEKGPWLCGEKLTLADIRLFPTIIRWETVYAPLFKCSQEPLWRFQNIISWRQKLFSIQNVRKTCNSKIWLNDYFGALFPLNPSSIIPQGPDLSQIVNH